MSRCPASGLDVELLRRETPGVAHRIHLNNAGAALPPAGVTEAVVAHLQREAMIGGYEAAAEAGSRLETVYDLIAQLINARANEIALTDSASRAWLAAFHAIPLQSGDRILTGVSEYGSNYISFLQRSRQTGATVEVVPDDAQGQLDVEALADMMDERVRLVAIGHVPTNSGLVNPVEAVGRVVRAWDCCYLLDTCQSVGQMPLDVDAIGCDFLTGTGRKFLRGPRGVGFLYVRGERLRELEPAWLDMRAATWVAADRYELRADAKRFESWEHSPALRLGLGAAVADILRHGQANIWRRIRYLADGLREELQALPGATLRDKGRLRCGIVSFTVDGHAAGDVVSRVREQGINLSASVVEMARLDMGRRGLTSTLRASVHAYNTEAEIHKLLTALRDL